MSTELGMILIGVAWASVWVWAVFSGYERTPKRKDLWLVLAFYVVSAHRPLPACGAKRNGDMVEWKGSFYECDATLGQWLKLGRDK